MTFRLIGSLLCGGVLMVGLTAAQALPLKPSLLTVESAATPAAMCGRCCRSCARGVRFIPGPPGVCARKGLAYCGPSPKIDTNYDGRTTVKSSKSNRTY